MAMWFLLVLTVAIAGWTFWLAYGNGSVPDFRDRGEQRLLRWAAENRLRLVKFERDNSPFKFFYAPGDCSNMQTLYRLRAMGADGAIVEGWLECGTAFRGLLSDRVRFFPEKWEAEEPYEDDVQEF